MPLNGEVIRVFKEEFKEENFFPIKLNEFMDKY